MSALVTSQRSGRDPSATRMVVVTTRTTCTSGARASNYCVDNYQQYLAKNPMNYRCHANTGVKFPS